MEGRRALDAACGSRSERTLKYDSIRRARFNPQIRKQRLKRFRACRVAITLALPLLPVLLSAQSGSVARPALQVIEQLITDQRWDEVAQILGKEQFRSAETDYDYGVALAHLRRFQEAEAALEAGRRLAPSDPRFSVELAGIAFKQKRYSRATRYLRSALEHDPADPYSNDFLGTVYFLQGNLPAALKYWNRVNKPVIAGVHDAPEPRVSPALLDHAFAFSPAGTLQMQQFLDSDSRIRALGIFPQYQLDLNARDDGSFDVTFRSQERNGFGDTKLESAFLLLRELPFQGISPEYYNLRRQAVNLTSLVRWDAQKRRLLAEFSSPFKRSASYRYALVTDLRNENWAIRNSFTGPAPTIASLNLRRESVSYGIASYASDRFGWSLGAETSHRDYRNIVPGTVLTPSLMASGYQLKQQAQLTSTILRIPEHRFTVSTAASSEAARLWSTPPRTFENETFDKLQGSIGWRWFPQSEGDDYEMQHQVRAGKTFGQIPFDELSMLGLERDNNLPMRAHIGTRDGVKGSAPLGRDYFLSSWESDKIIYGNGLITLKLGPLLDVGTINDPSPALGSHKWLFDAGAQVKVRVFSTTVAFSYGKDLRSGNNAFYVMLPK
jgi:Tetratricopeptide repeat